jgi:hypothetical protein
MTLPLHFVKNILQIIKRPQRHTQMTHNTIRRRQMEMEIRNRILRHIVLTRRKPEVAHLGLHDYFLVGHRIHGLGFGGL